MVTNGSKLRDSRRESMCESWPQNLAYKLPYITLLILWKIDYLGFFLPSLKNSTFLSRKILFTFSIKQTPTNLVSDANGQKHQTFHRKHQSKPKFQWTPMKSSKHTCKLKLPRFFITENLIAHRKLPQNPDFGHPYLLWFSPKK